MNKKEYFIKPFHHQILESFPFIAEDFDQLTEYELYCKLCAKMDEVIAGTNKLDGDVNEYIGKFNALKSYVDNYFDNLDVQDEINNKLDAMAQAGTLQEIIASYLDSKAVFGFDTVADMKTATNLLDGSYARTMGFYSKNDGGNALYKIREVTNDDTVDEMLIIEMTNDNTLVAELITDGSTINIKQLGAKNSSANTNNNDIVNYLNKAYTNFSTIIIPSGEYYLSEFSPNCVGVQNKIIKGLGNTKIFTANGFIFNGSLTEPYNQRVMNVTIRDLGFYGSGRSNSNRNGQGVTFNHFGECYIDNCYFCWFNQALNLIEGSEMTISNTIALSSNIGIYIERNTGDLDAVTFDSCVISNSGKAVLVESVRGVNFNDCVLINSSASDKGVVIQNTNAHTEQINFTNCEFENNQNEIASIIIGDTSESYTTQFVNIYNSKFTMSANYGIDVVNAKRLNITDTVFTYSYNFNIRVGANVPADFKITLDGNAEVLPLHILDNRTSYITDYIPKTYKRLNFYPDMSRSVIEFNPSVTSIAYADNTVTFGANGYMGFDLIKDTNFNQDDGVYIVAIGQNIGQFTAVINGSNVDISNSTTLQTLSNGDIVKKAFVKNADATSIRLNFVNGTTLSYVAVYGSAPAPLPVCYLANISLDKYIGSPKKGDIISVRNNGLSTGGIAVYDGSQFNIM